MCRPVDLYFVGLLLFSIQCFTAFAVALIYCKLFFITNTAMRPEKQLAGRIKVLHGHKKTVAYAHETCIDSDPLSEGFITRFYYPLIGLGWHLMWQTLHVSVQTEWEWVESESRG